MIDEEGRELGTGALMKYMTVAKLREILVGLPDNALVMPNSVANLAVYASPWSTTNYLGAIDFAGERFERDE